MKVLHSDADSITVLDTIDGGYLVYSVSGITSAPRLQVSARGAARIDGVLWESTLGQSRRVPATHTHAGKVRAFMATYIDSGALDSYRDGLGHGVPRLAL